MHTPGLEQDQETEHRRGDHRVVKSRPWTRRSAFSDKRSYRLVAGCWRHRLALVLARESPPQIAVTRSGLLSDFEVLDPDNQKLSCGAEHLPEQRRFASWRSQPVH